MTAQNYSQPMNTNPTIENQGAAVSVGSDRLFGVPYLVDNLREWAAEFRANLHPVTLTLFRAIQTLEKMDAAIAKDEREKAHLHAEIGRYRASIDNYCQTYDEGVADSKDMKRLREVLEPLGDKPVPVWQKYSHPSEVSISPNNRDVPTPVSNQKTQ